MPSSPQAEKPSPSAEDPAVAEFIARWKSKDGGERSSYQLFISELFGILSPRSVSFANTKEASPLQEMGISFLPVVSEIEMAEVSQTVI